MVLAMGLLTNNAVIKLKRIQGMSAMIGTLMFILRLSANNESIEMTKKISEGTL